MVDTIERDRVKEAFVQANAASEPAIAAKSQYLAIMSHELPRLADDTRVSF